MPRRRRHCRRLALSSNHPSSHPPKGRIVTQMAPIAPAADSCRIATFHIRGGCLGLSNTGGSRVVEGHLGELLGTTCGLPDCAMVPPITADVGMQSKLKPFTGRIVQAASARIIVSPTRVSSPPTAAARRDDLAVISERLDMLSALVLKLSKEVESIRTSSRGKRLAKKPAASQLSFDFEAWPVSKRTG
jgi:hypothetical protein